LNTCSVGVATQDPELRKRFRGAAENLVTYFSFLSQEVRETLASLGCRSLDELVGRSDLLEVDDTLKSWKSEKLDLKNVFFRPSVEASIARRRVQKQDYGLDKAMDLKLIEMCRPALEEKKAVSFDLEIRNVHRTVGAMLSGEISRRYADAGLPPDTIRLNFKGTAGQSFAAFGARGITFRLEGDANDYLGKGLSGARVIVVPPGSARFKPEENIIAGNVLLYGATEGDVFIRGIVGERFGVRNSGVNAVVEGVGDHGCEYMTGGRVVVIGPTGRNFAAGMSGGIAYVLDLDKTFASRCNKGMVELGLLVEEGDIATVRGLLEQHARFTGSTVADDLLKDWARACACFVRVMPLEYKQALGKTAKKAVEDEGEVSDG
jgi:glutamate synthase (NADPH/NADH) large chain